MGILSNIELIKGKIYNNLLFSLHKIRYGDNLIVNGTLRFQGNGKMLHIGNNVIINSGWRFNPTGGVEKTGIALYGGELTIGNNVGISNTNIICVQTIIIEDDVTIGSGTRIMDSNFHSIEYKYRMENPDTHIKTAPITIKKGAFIGAYSVILKGVTIGEMSVVAAGSVVSCPIPDNEIWGGNPAKFIKKI